MVKLQVWDNDTAEYFGHVYIRLNPNKKREIITSYFFPKQFENSYFILCMDQFLDKLMFLITKSTISMPISSFVSGKTSLNSEFSLFSLIGPFFSSRINS